MEYAEGERFCRAAEKGIQHSTIECELTGTDCCDKGCC